MASQLSAAATVKVNPTRTGAIASGNTAMPASSVASTSQAAGVNCGRTHSKATASTSQTSAACSETARMPSEPAASQPASNPSATPQAVPRETVMESREFMTATDNVVIQPS